MNVELNKQSIETCSENDYFTFSVFERTVENVVSYCGAFFKKMLIGAALDFPLSLATAVELKDPTNIIKDREILELKLTFSVAVIKAPIKEELIFRGLIQHMLLKKLPEMTCRYAFPKYVHLINSKAAKLTRIVATALAFSAMHLNNSSVVSDEYLKAQVLSTFLTGLAMGWMKESDLGIASTIGMHIYHNFFAYQDLKRLGNF